MVKQFLDPDNPIRALWDDVVKLGFLIILTWMAVNSTMIRVAVDDRTTWREQTTVELQTIQQELDHISATLDTLCGGPPSGRRPQTPE